MNLRRIIASFAGSAALLAIAYTVAQALCIGCPQPGSLLTCGLNRFSCTATISTQQFGISTFTTGATVLPTFTVVGSGANPASSQLQPRQWAGTGANPVLGNVNWQFDVNRPVANTTIVANQLEGDFPATVHIRFHIRGTISAFPGIVFQSATPLDVRSNNVTSFAPFNNETFTLAEPVLFVDAANPQGQRFTMTSLTLQLNG